jgi:uncharacterized protein (DUF488 family)
MQQFMPQSEKSNFRGHQRFNTRRHNLVYFHWHLTCTASGKMERNHKMIWTIGHSTRTIDEFIALLQSFEIDLLVDVRHFPGSRKYPHFNMATLSASLMKAHIKYEHLESLGGRRKPKPDSINTAWRHPAFRGYADYMETSGFKDGMTALRDFASENRIALMCSEAVWWRCHRSLISDLLKSEGWLVLHIMEREKSKEHPFTAPAKIVNGKLTYQSMSLS